MTPNNNQPANILQQSRQEIIEIINEGGSEIKEVIDDAVKMLMELDSIPGIVGVIKKTTELWKNKRKREVLKDICNSILREIFDPAKEYKMCIADIKRTCEAKGGTFVQELNNTRVYERLYDIIIQKLSDGPLREKCNDIGLIDYVNIKIVDIKWSKMELSVGSEVIYKKLKWGSSYGSS